MNYTPRVTSQPMELGSRLKAARKAAGYSQSKLAELCGWDAPSRLANYEQGTREPTLADLRLIASKINHPEYSFPWIALGDEAQPQSQVERLSALTILSAARLASQSLQDPHPLDPADPDDAELLAAAIDAVLSGGLGDSTEGESLRFARRGTAAGGTDEGNRSDRTDGRTHSTKSEAKAGRSGSSTSGGRRKSA